MGRRSSQYLQQSTQSDCYELERKISDLKSELGEKDEIIKSIKPIGQNITATSDVAIPGFGACFKCGNTVRNLGNALVRVDKIGEQHEISCQPSSGIISYDS